MNKIDDFDRDRFSQLKNGRKKQQQKSYTKWKPFQNKIVALQREFCNVKRVFF